MKDKIIIALAIIAYILFTLGFFGLGEGFIYTGIMTSVYIGILLIIKGFEATK